MKISSMFAARRPLISFEFFPPKTDDGFVSLMNSIADLRPLQPSYVSVTYGAGGSTRQKTVALVAKVKNELGLEAAAHLTCVGHTKSELKAVLNELKDHGIENVLALRGDPPRGETTFTPTPDGFRYASELVRFIRETFPFSIGVAGYPEKHIEASSMEDDIAHLKEKVAAGGDFIITQLFFDNRDYFAYVERLRKEGVTNPVIAGIMPVTDLEQIKRFASMCGAALPKALVQKLEEADGDKARVIQVGIDHAVQQCRDLLKRGVPGIHFYTLNKSHSTREIFMRLKAEGAVS